MPPLNTLEKDQLLRVIGRLDERLRKIESNLQGQPISTVRIADAAITSAKIGNLNANKITTGILTVKDGSDGIAISVLKSNDSLAVTIDSDGIAVYGGNIIVYNSDGNAVFDALGIVSQNNFVFDSVTASLGTTSSSASYADLDSMTLTTPSFPRSAVVLVIFTVNSKTANNVGAGSNPFNQFAINIDGSDQTEVQALNQQYQDDGSWNGVFQSSTTHLVKLLGTGTHTIKVRWRTGGIGTNTVEGRTLTYVVLGK